MLTGNRKLVHLILLGNLTLLKTAGTISAAQDFSTISSWEVYSASSSRIKHLSQLSKNQAAPNLESQGLIRILQLADNIIMNWQEVLTLRFSPERKDCRGFYYVRYCLAPIVLGGLALF